jgi:WD40 repeat protein
MNACCRYRAFSATTKALCWPIPIIASLFTPGPGSAHQPLDTPILRIETGVHTGDITGLAVDRDGDLLATCSYDKTLRLWSLADPSAPARVIRMPLDLDREGALYAVALSPDGREAVTGGWTGSWDGGALWSLYVFDTTTGAMLKRIPTLSGRMVSLNFSRDGMQLAAGLKDRPGIVLFNTRDWSVAARDDEQRDDIPSIDIDAHGRVVSVSLGGTINLYEPGLQRKRAIQAPGGNEPAVVRFSPDGSIIAVGYSDSARVDLISAEDLSLVSSADIRGIDKGFIALAWSPNGDYLYGAGDYERGGHNPIRRWSDGGRGPARDFPVPLAVVTRLQTLADGRLAFTTQGGTVGILDASMQLVWVRRSGIADFRNQADTLRASADGGIVEFSYDRFGNFPVRFSLATKSLSVGNPSDPQLAAALTETSELKVLDWSGTEHPTLNGSALPLKTHDQSLSLAISPDHKSVLLGTTWRVIRFDESGTVVWDIQAPAATWAVAVTGNGQLAVAAFSDGTIRWLRMSDGQVLLTLFPEADTRHWVAWTQSGYYIASPGGDTLVGWHVNRGEDSAADFFSVGRFRDVYYRPDVVEKILGVLDEGRAMRRGDAETSHAGESLDVGSLLPPVITMSLESGDAPVRSAKVSFEYRIRRSTTQPIKTLEVRADGRPIVTIAAGERPIAESGRIDAYIPRRDTTVEMIAETAAGIWSEPAVVRLRWDGPPEDIKPSLFVLAIGIADYRVPELKLKFAAKDADDIKTLFAHQDGRAYRHVEVVSLKDGEATRANLLRALEWLSSAPSSRDVAMLFMAGHGADDRGGQYFFVPQDVGPKEAFVHGLPYLDIRVALEQVAGRVFFFLDTCHSGAAWGEPATSAADVSRIVNDLKSPEYGIVTFASSTGRQLSYESPEWGNGAFTKAVIEGLSGKADFFNNGYVTTTELEAYVSDRVPKLTAGRQTPAIGRPISADSTLVSLSDGQ